jgi:hypothetical protein
MSLPFILTEAGPALTPSQLDAFELEMGGRLPQDYRQFLLESNGGWLEPELGFHAQGRLNKVVDFYRLEPSPDAGVRLALDNLRAMRVEDLCPITSTMNQEEICLSTTGTIGSVWLASCLDRSDVELLRIAESFTEFLAILVELPESS